MKSFFEDRSDAGRELAIELQKLRLDSPVVVALPRGGVVIAAEISKALKCPHDLILVRKIGAPFNSELAVGAVVEGSPPQAFMNDELVQVLKVSDEYIQSEKAQQTDELRRQDKLYREGAARASLKAKSVILVDDGVATGASIRAALRGIKNDQAKRIVLAVPVAPPDLVAELKKEVDDLICLCSPKNFRAVGQFYRNFGQISDDEVKTLLRAH